MTRKATDVVTTIGIDIGKNSFLLIGLEGCFGSKAAVGATPCSRPESGAEPSKSTEPSACSSITKLRGWSPPRDPSRYSGRYPILARIK